MPPSSKPSPFEILQHRIVEVHWRWKVWQQLWMSTSENIKLMDKFASTFFEVSRLLMIHDIVMRLSKLTDPESGRGRENLVLLRALRLAKGYLRRDDLRNAQAAARALEEAVKPLRTIRNRHIAHEDLATAVGKDSLPDLSPSKIRSAIDAATNLIRAIDPKARDREFVYDGAIARGDGDSLLDALRWADEFLALQRPAAHSSS